MDRYVFDAYCLDTTPGNASSPFLLSMDWDGDENVYLRWLREQFRASPEFRQWISIVARAKRQDRFINVKGPYSSVLC
jgi:hypothetical protein